MSEVEAFTEVCESAHSVSFDQIINCLQSDEEHGLSLIECNKRLNEFGLNQIPEQSTSSPLQRLWEQINSMIIYILIVGAVISFAFHHHIDGIVIVGVVVINVGMGYTMESQAINATNSLKKMMSPTAQTIRDGEKGIVDSISLVPGDIILLQAGDVVPADARIIKQTNLQVMEAPLTGESHAVLKDATQTVDLTSSLGDRICMVFSGTQVLRGTATCIVIATGEKCEIGRISGLLSEIKATKTPLLLQLERFGLILSLIIISGAFGTFGIAWARGYNVDEALSIAIGVAVAAIPEGLPSCITVCFAKGVSFLAGRHAIVKSLPAVETLGSVSVICSDKTGTLTMNKMAVKSVVCADSGAIEVNTDTVSTTGSPGQADLSADAIFALVLPGLLCNDSSLQLSTDICITSPAAGSAGVQDVEMAFLSFPHSPRTPCAAEQSEYIVQGDPTESCIFELALQLLGSAPDVKQTLRAYPRLSEIPFDSAAKYMATLHFLDADLVAKMTGAKVALSDGQRVKAVLVKGAPERVLGFCYGSEDPGRAYWTSHAVGLAENGMRVLALAYRIVPMEYELPAELNAAEDVLEPAEHFHMTSLLGIIDPPRPEAILAVADAQAAGIVVKMITGDHPVTALAIGKTLGLHVSQNRAIKGIELDEITVRSMTELDRTVVNNDVFARTTPEHKLRIVESLRRQGYVCSMTGDGVNDAPALKAADIGVAMGITGTEVAKDAANMIITDDNFATIVDAIRIGRCTYANLIKIIAFVLPTNGGQAFSIIGALIIDVDIPITALQILWVNMVTSVTLGIVLAFDKPDRTVLSEAPRRSGKPIFGKLLTWRVALVTAFLILAVLGMYRWETHRGHSQEYLRTVCVNTLVAAQVGYIFNCRNLRTATDAEGIFLGNFWLYVGIGMIAVCQLLFTYAPGFQYTFQTRGLDAESWGKIAIMAIAVFCAVEVDKMVNTLRRQYGCCVSDDPDSLFDSVLMMGAGTALPRNPSAHSLHSHHSHRSSRSRLSAHSHR